MQVLSVSKDFALLSSREQILRSIGLQVTSALGFTDAIRECESSRFDLFLLGHSIPIEERRALITQFRLHCAAPILEMYKPNSVPTGMAQFEFDSSRSPRELAELVVKILRLTVPKKAKARRTSEETSQRGLHGKP